MSDIDNQRSPDSTIDTELARILEQYLQDQEDGKALPRDQWLAQHPEIADRLAACLDGAELMGAGGFGGFLAGEVRYAKPESATSTPKTIGDYEILGELGRGGMGVVYEAREKSLDRIVALKVMRFGVVDPKALERFQREAETAGDLHHTNIVPVYATGREGDTSWYAMQRIEGESLADRIADAKETSTPISLHHILQFGIQAAEALDHAHQRNVIHRDVKPANLIVDGEDRVWLTDFGLARRLVDVGATMTGAMLGTPRYMSPEQAGLKEGVDHRTDIYSLGATLFELAAGRPPFEANDPLNVITQIRYEEPSGVRQLRRELPRDLEVVLAKCLEKAPDRRYASAAALAEDLRAVSDDRAISARPISILERATRSARKHASRLRVTGLAIAATAATILLASFAWQSWSDSQLGSFRFRAGGGPYASLIRPVNETSFSANSRLLTVPMESPLSIQAGDYDLMLAPKGRWSQRVRLNVTQGQRGNYRMGSAPRTNGIDISGTNASVVAGFEHPAVLLRRNGVLSRVAPSGETAWDLDVSSIETKRLSLKDPKAAPIATTIDFANTKNVINSPLNRARFESNPQYAAARFALQTPIDIDGDSRSDTIVAAIDRPSLAAVDADGAIIWGCTYDISGSYESKTLFFPSVLEIVDAGDQNDDGVNDLIASMVMPDNGLKTDTAIMLVSGKSGDVISHVQTPAMQGASARVDCTPDTFFRVTGNTYRDSGTITFGRSGIRRNRINWSVNQTLWRESRPTFSVPAPMCVVQSDDELLVTHHFNDQCHVYELNKGVQVGKTVTLPFKKSAAPRVASLGDDGHVLIFHETEQTVTSTPNAGIDFVAYGIRDGKRLWRYRAPHVDWKETRGDESRADWPLIVDNNGDGVDEVIVPTVQRPYEIGPIGVTALDSRTGKHLWPTHPHQVSHSAEQVVHRVVQCADINGDGWREIVTATVGGARPDQPTSEGGVFVYVEWICGKAGRVLSWSRNRVDSLSEQVDVAEIAAIRSQVPGGDTGAIEIDLVTGDSRVDLELDSAVIRFHPSSPDPISIAAGLDAVDLPNIAGSTQRVFYSRPGPYSDGPESLLFLNDAPSVNTRLGGNQLVAFWTEEGQDLLAIMQDEPRKLVVVDATTHETIWSKDLPSSAVCTQVRRSNGEVDILACLDPANRESGELLDGRTGRMRWITSDSLFGRLVFAKSVDDDERILIVSDGRVNSSGFPRPPDCFRMTMVDASNGNVVWGKYFLRGAPRHNYPTGFDELRFVDLNRDGVMDIVGPDQAEEKELMLAAWDGVTGEQLWSHSLFFRGPLSDYFVPFCTVNDARRSLIAYCGPENLAERDVSKLIIVDGESGRVLSTAKIAGVPVRHPDREHGHRLIAIADCSTELTKPQVGIQSVNAQGENEWRLYDLGDPVKPDSSGWTTSWSGPEKTFATNRWIQDIDGDNVPERLIASRKQNSRDYQLSCFQLDAKKPTWTQRFAGQGQVRRVHTPDDNHRNLLYVEFAGEYVLVDAVSGRKLHKIATSGDQNGLPMVTSVYQEGDSTGYRLAEPVKEGLISHWVGDTADVSVSMPPHSLRDPRRTKPFLSIGGSPSVSSWDIIRGAAQSVFAFVALVLIPWWYIGRMIRERRWSLSWMLLAPPVAVLFFSVWSSEWLLSSGRLASVISGMAWMVIPAVAYRVVFRGQRRERVWLFLCILAAASLVLTFSVLRASDSTYDYIVRFDDVVRTSLMCISFGIQFYCVFFAIRWVSRVRRERRNRRAEARRIATFGV